jgi:CheY-like chemotaxis protein
MMASRATASAETGQPVILVVEDEELVRLSAVEFLRFSDYQVLEAPDADTAIDMLNTGLEVDLVFSDVRMPGRLDGFGLADWVHTHRPSVPVLLTSGYVGTARSIGRAPPILSKPYSFQRLLQKIDELLRE